MENDTESTQFKALFEHSSVGIIISNNEGVMQKINPFAAQMFGYDVGELVGQKIEVLIPKRLHKQHVGYRQMYAKDPTPRAMARGVDLAAIKKDLSEFYVEISLSFYKFKNELRIVSFVNDVTETRQIKIKLKEQAQELEATVKERTKELSNALSELNHLNENLEKEISTRKKIEKQVREAFEKERELNELKSRFVSMASHEFRTPLGGILTSVSLLDRYNKSQDFEVKREKHIKTIKNSVKSLTSILNDFLSLDKLEQGKIGAHPDYFFLNDTIDEIVADLKDMIPQDYSINISHLSDNKKLYQDRELLKNIIVNLVSNAVKYSSSNKPIELEVSTSNNLVTVTIQDHGIGIPKNDQKNLFERFFRASNATNIQGTGLGLTIVKKYLEFMYGQIDFQSQEGIGTTFEISFPAEIKK